MPVPPYIYTCSYISKDSRVSTCGGLKRPTNRTGSYKNSIGYCPVKGFFGGTLKTSRNTETRRGFKGNSSTSYLTAPAGHYVSIQLRIRFVKQ